jgi:hypothetical protein
MCPHLMGIHEMDPLIIYFFLRKLLERSSDKIQINDKISDKSVFIKKTHLDFLGLCPFTLGVGT